MGTEVDHLGHLELGELPRCVGGGGDRPCSRSELVAMAMAPRPSLGPSLARAVT